MKIVAAGLVAALLMTFAFFVPYMTADEELSGDVSASDTLLIPEETEGNGISLLSAAIPREDYDEYGIMPTALGAYTVTATVKDSEGVAQDFLQHVSWSMAWASENPDSVWDYVDMKQQGCRATFTCKEVFSTRIVVTCASTTAPDKTATVNLDYAPAYQSFKVQFFSDPEFVSVSRDGNYASATFPSRYEGGGSVVTTGNFISTNFSFFKEAVFKDEGSISNSVNHYDITITPTEELKGFYDQFKGSSISTSLQAVSANSNYLSDVSNLNNFYAALTGVKGNMNALGGMSIYRALSLALYRCNNDFEVSLTLDFLYGERVQTSYKLRVSMDKDPVGSVSLSSLSHVFY